MLPVRKNTRLSGFDYSTAGYYFVTICTHDRQPILGRIEFDRTICNPIGNDVVKAWQLIPVHFPGVRADTFCMMPEHVHMILQLLDGASAPLGDVIRNFKSTSARSINKRRRSTGRVWQRGYYEHIVRTERSLNMIRLYIRLNPLMRTKGLSLGTVIDWTDERIEQMLKDFSADIQ